MSIQIVKRDTVTGIDKFGKINPEDMGFEISANYDNVVEYANLAALLLNPSPDNVTLYITTDDSKEYYWKDNAYHETSGGVSFVKGTLEGQIPRWNNDTKLWTPDIGLQLNNPYNGAGLYFQTDNPVPYEYANRAAFPAVGNKMKVYKALDSGKYYYWSKPNYYELPNQNLFDVIAEFCSTYPTSRSIRFYNDGSVKIDELAGNGTVPLAVDNNGKIIVSESGSGSPQIFYKPITLTRDRIIGDNGETDLKTAGFKVFDAIANKIIIPIGITTNCEHFDYTVNSNSFNFYYGNTVDNDKFVFNLYLPTLVGVTQTFWGTAAASFYGQGGVNEDIYVWAQNTITDAGGTSTSVDIMIAYIVIDITGAETMPEGFTESDPIFTGWLAEHPNAGDSTPIRVLIPEADTWTKLFDIDVPNEGDIQNGFIFYHLVANDTSDVTGDYPSFYDANYTNYSVYHKINDDYGNYIISRSGTWQITQDGSKFSIWVKSVIGYIDYILNTNSNGQVNVISEESDPIAMAAIAELATVASTGDYDDLTNKPTIPDAISDLTDDLKRAYSIQVFQATTAITTGDGKAYFLIPDFLNGKNLISAYARVITAGATNDLTIQVNNVTDNVDMLSPAITVANTATSGTGTIDTSHDDVATNDLLRIDIDAVQTTAPYGLIILLEFQ
jgi:hypothetical protein